MAFKENLLKSLVGLERTLGNFTYLPWVAAMYHAGSPEVRVRLFDGKPYLPVFGSAVVCVEVKMPNGDWQETWLPALDTEQNVIPLEEIDARVVNDLLSRCKAKAIAMTCGIGLALYDGKSTADAVRFYKEASLDAVKAGMSFEEMAKISVMPRTNQNQAPYVPWVYSIAAARLADENFKWWVEDLIIEVNGTYMVAIGVRFNGREQIEYYPIMTTAEISVGSTTIRQAHVAATEPTVMHLNNAIMRALARSIALVSGYGITVYLMEGFEHTTEQASDAASPQTAQSAQPAQPAQPKPTQPMQTAQTPEAENSDAVSPQTAAMDEVQQLVEKIKDILKSEARIQKTLDAAVRHGFVAKRPATLEELVMMSPEAARHILKAYGKA